MAREIEIIINTDGNAEMDFINFRGAGCEEEAKKIIKALGGDVEDLVRKPEFYQQESYSNEGQTRI